MTYTNVLPQEAHIALSISVQPDVVLCITTGRISFGTNAVAVDRPLSSVDSNCCVPMVVVFANPCAPSSFTGVFVCRGNVTLVKTEEISKLQNLHMLRALVLKGEHYPSHAENLYRGVWPVSSYLMIIIFGLLLRNNFPENSSYDEVLSTRIHCLFSCHAMVTVKT